MEGEEKTILVVGASAGGSTMLPELVKQLTVDMNLSVFIVLHLSKSEIGQLLADRLQRHTAFICKIAEHGEEIQAGRVYVSKPDHHLMVKDNKILLGSGPLENRYRPSIDALFRSAAVYFAPKVIGIILSGMLEDGASGMLAIKKSGGICIIQDPKEARYSDMPQAVLNLLKPDYVTAVSGMGKAIEASLLALKGREKVTVPEEIVKESKIAEEVNIGIENIIDLGDRSWICCPDCGGALVEMKDDGSSRYRCHVGHAFTEEGLLTNIESSTEATLWTALRMIEERKNLLKQIGEKESRKGNAKLAASYFERSEEMDGHAHRLKEILFGIVKHPA